MKSCIVKPPLTVTWKFLVDTRADPAIFLGYPFGQKAYKVYNLTTNKIIVSKDITVHEQHFPYHLKTNFSSPFSTSYLPIQTTFIKSALLPNSTLTTPIFPSTQRNNHTQPAAYSTSNQVVDLSQHLDLAPLRRSTRIHKKPAHLQDFMCQTQSHWYNLVNVSSFSTQHHTMGRTYNI